jgi:hypothetical protein
VLIDDAGERRYMRRCVMVCLAFYGPRPEGMTARHGDGTRTNDAKSNLSWATQAVNCQDKLAHGTAQRGERSANVTITEAAARHIKTSTFGMTAAQVAAEIGCKKGVVHSIRQGRTWGWL